MPRYVYEDEEGNQILVGSDEELEIDDEESEDDEDSEDETEDEDEPSEDDDEDEDEDEDASGKDTPAQFAFVEAFFKTERAAIRQISDLTELRLKRQSYEAALRTPNPSQIGLVRVRDLLALVEQRELDLRAKRLAERKH